VAHRPWRRSIIEARMLSGRGLSRPVPPKGVADEESPSSADCRLGCRYLHRRIEWRPNGGWQCRAGFRRTGRTGSARGPRDRQSRALGLTQASATSRKLPQIGASQSTKSLLTFIFIKASGCRLTQREAGKRGHIVVTVLSQNAGTTIFMLRDNMKAKKPLTDRAISSAKAAPPGKRVLLWDALVPGLAVRVSDTGRRSFVLVKRFPGSANPVPRSIGTYGAISLEDARDKAREWHKLISQGIDPARQRAETFHAIAEEFLAREGPRLRTADQRKATLDRLILPTLGLRPIGEIKRSEIIRLLDRIEDERGPRMADGALEVIRRIMSWHASRSDEFRSPIVRGMSRTRPSERARERVLSDDELRAVWTAATGPFGSMVRFILLTAARRNEASELRWVELVEGDWILPASRNKAKQDLVRPLSKAALAVLGPSNGGSYVFSANSGATPISGFSKFKAALDEASGTSGWTLHDCRRTARSLMSRGGVNADVAERCLGHVISGVRGTYDRHEYYEEKRRAFDALAAQIDRIINPQDNVVGLRR
jgi:integrase